MMKYKAAQGKRKDFDTCKSLFQNKNVRNGYYAGRMKTRGDNERFFENRAASWR